MKLSDFKFPSVVDSAFASIGTSKELLAEAKDRGFYNGHTEYNKLFKDLFFKGGKVGFKKNLDEEWAKKAWAYCRAFMRSWEPKHEEKEAICALIMSELLQPKLS